MVYTDRALICKECGQPFPFTAQEQEYYQMRGFANEPARCLECREARKRRR